MTTPILAVTLRPFQEADYARFVEIRTLATPDSPASETIIRHDDANWEHEKHFLLRLMAEDTAGRVVGCGQLRHTPWSFHPDRYHLSIHVDPAFQRRGVGSLFYARFVELLRERNALLVRADAQESMKHSVDFLDHRGFTDVQRSWESRLRLRDFDLSAFEGAEERAERQGVVLTTMEAEGLPADERRLRAVYDLDCLCARDEPSIDPLTVHSFEGWRKDVVEAPHFLPAAAFLAKDGERYVGLSFLFDGTAVPEAMGQGFTAVHPDYRGRGIAMALKVRGVRYALDHGYEEIRTHNNTRNAPMLRINEAMGFAKQPVWITFQKMLRDA